MLRRRAAVLRRGAVLDVALVAAGVVLGGGALAGCTSSSTYTTPTTPTSSSAGAVTTAPTSGPSGPPGATEASGPRPACAFHGDEGTRSGTATGTTLRLADVSIGGHGCFDRVVLTFRAVTAPSSSPGFTVSYKPGPFSEDASGRPVPVKGSAFLVIGVMPASGADEGGAATYTGPADVSPPAGVSRVVDVRRAGDFEGRITWIVGLDARRPFTVSVLTAPTRLVTDVG